MIVRCSCIVLISFVKGKYRRKFFWEGWENGRFGKAGRIERARKAGRAEKAEKAGRNGKAEKVGRNGKAEKVGRNGRRDN